MKLHSLAAVWLLITALNAQAQKLTHADSLMRQLHQPNSRQVMVVAHRGDWRNGPENSLPAFKSAVAMGVDLIELDLAKTKDGILVIMHDATIDRTTDGKGKPGDYTLAEIKQFHLRNGLGRITRNTIPTLLEVLQVTKGKALLNLDKSYPYYNEAFQALKQTGTLQQALFKAEVTSDELKARYPTLIDSITFMAIVNLDKPGARKIISDYQQQLKPVAFELNFRSDTSSILNNTRFIPAHGSKVWINSLWASLNAGHDDDRAVEEDDKKDSWDWIIAHGATLIQTDRPRELLQYLRKKHLHQ